jgi:undecaprenyl-diphosphatase
MCCGLTREAAARFSFLLSIPSILAAGLFQLVDARQELLSSSADAAKLGVALVVTALVGYATIPWLLGYLRKRTMLVFIVYRLLLAAFLLWLLATGRITS